MSAAPTRKSVRLVEPTPETDEWDVQPVIDWLAQEGRLVADPGGLIEQMGERLVDAGAPISRFTLGLQTIHPQWRTMGVSWRRGEKAVVRDTW